MQTERARLIDAPERILAEDLTARVTQPPFAASAMDGYAVRFADMAPGARLRVIGESPAGAAFDGALQAGEAVRIFTGGVVPAGADHVIIQEDVNRDGDAIVIVEAQHDPSNIRAAGIDFREGDIVLRAGQALHGARLALAAAANVAELNVARPPVVAILASGDELAEPGSQLKPGQIVGSTGYGLAALIAEWGGQPRLLGTAGDTIASVHAMLDGAADADLVVPLGGASVGDRDVSPGKPTWFGQAGEQRVLGLPGNPASALVCAQLFVKPLLWAATGRKMADAVKRTAGRLAEDAPGNGPRETYLRAYAEIGPDGVLAVTHFPRQDSSLLTPFAASNCLLRLAPNAPSAKTGDPCEVLLLDGGL